MPQSRPRPQVAVYAKYAGYQARYVNPPLTPITPTTRHDPEMTTHTHANQRRQAPPGLTGSPYPGSGPSRPRARRRVRALSGVRAVPLVVVCRRPVPVPASGRIPFAGMALRATCGACWLVCRGGLAGGGRRPQTFTMASQSGGRGGSSLADSYRTPGGGFRVWEGGYSPLPRFQRSSRSSFRGVESCIRTLFSPLRIAPIGRIWPSEACF